MRPKLFARFHGFDWVLLGAALVLVGFGLVVLFSLTLNVDRPDLAAVRGQAVYAAIGLALFFLFSFLDYRMLRSAGWLLYVLGALLLVGVAVFGTEIRNVKSWFVLGPFTFQPVELAKLCLIVFFAKYFTEHLRDILALRHLVVSGSAAALYVLLTLLQPDLGSSIIFLGVFAALAVLVNVRKSHLFLLVFAFVVGAVASWFLVFHDYQRDRILVLVHAKDDPDIAYNVDQAIVAIGSGRVFGRGLGLGSQSQLNFLPEQRSDFIFAVTAEELGFVGAGLLLTLYVVVLLRLFRLVRRVHDEFGALLIFGIAMMLFIQVLMNIGMNIGFLPVVGVPLPLVSAGGSSLLVVFIGLGIAENVHRQQAARERLA